jgi:hypothetical protein
MPITHPLTIARDMYRVFYALFKHGRQVGLPNALIGGLTKHDVILVRNPDLFDPICRDRRSDSNDLFRLTFLIREFG